MVMSKPDDLNAEVADAVGELANMIAGGAKAQLEEYEMSITLPTVIIGCYESIEFPSDTPSLCIGFKSDWGILTVQVALVEETAPVAS